MLTILLILLIVLLFGGIGGSRLYRGRRRTVVRKYDQICDDRSPSSPGSITAG